MRRTLRIDIAYDGTDLVGWQRQSNGPTAQQHVEEALAAACAAERVVVEGASRTDAGVHALHQVASAVVDTRLDLDQLRRAMHSRLPPSIRILTIRDAPEGFHARYFAEWKRYLYQIESSDRRTPIGRHYAAWTPRPLDLAAMRGAARAFIGKHDFAAFAGAANQTATTVRTVHHLHIFRRRDRFLFAVQGDGFLYNQVRTMVGTLIAVGLGNLASQRVAEILRSRDRRLAGPTAPAHGLTLARVQIGAARRTKPGAEADEERDA